MKLLNLLFLIIFSLAETYPGVVTSISLKAVNNLLQQSFPELISDLSDAKIPSGTFRLKFFLIPFKLKLSNIAFTEISFDTTQSGLQVNNLTGQIYLTLFNFNFNVFFDYNYYIPIDIPGNCTISLTNSTLIVPLTLSVNNAGKVSSEIYPLQGNLDSLDIELVPQGPISNFFNVITHLWPFKKITNHVLVNFFDSFSVMLNPKLEKILSTIKYTDQIGTLPIAADYHFYRITLQPYNILATLNGTFYLLNDLSAISTLTPPNYLPGIVSQASIVVQLTQYYFDSMMWALYTSNYLNIYIPSQSIPKSFPYQFTTNGLSKLIPNFATVYGNNLPVDLECSVYQVPILNLETQVSMTASVSCNFLVRISSNITVNAFTLLTQFYTDFIASISEENGGVYMFVSLDETNTQFSSFSLINSHVGIFNLARISQAVNWYTYYVVFQANNLLENQGIRLPLPEGIKVKSARFNIYPGALEIDLEPEF